jgi:hypothetical protein
MEALGLAVQFEKADSDAGSDGGDRLHGRLVVRVANFVPAA